MRFCALSPFTTNTSALPASRFQLSSASLRTCRTPLRRPTTIRPFAKAPSLRAPSEFATSTITFADRLAASMAGLMNMTFPVNMRPGSVSDEKSSVCPTRTDASRDDGTDTVRSSTRLSTMRNIDALPPMFSTRSPTLTPRSATTPSIGALMSSLLRCVSAALICARAAVMAASDASTAVLASSRACGVIRPYCFSCCARSYSRCARFWPTLACASAALNVSMPASVSRLSSRASLSPRFTGTHSVT